MRDRTTFFCATYVEIFAKFAGGKAVEIQANGRADWIGWLELQRVRIDAAAIRNTARVIAEVNPDVLLLIEVEDRVRLQRFYDTDRMPAALRKSGGMLTPVI